MSLPREVLEAIQRQEELREYDEALDQEDEE